MPSAQLVDDLVETLVGLDSGNGLRIRRSVERDNAIQRLCDPEPDVKSHRLGLDWGQRLYRYIRVVYDARSGIGGRVQPIQRPETPK